MEGREFNLLREPWIRVMMPDCGERDVSLLELFGHAHEYRSLAGEMPHQDIAVFRLLEAVLHTVFTRRDENGAENPIESPEEAVRRWKAVWDAGQFPEEVVGGYLREWEDRFWLFDKVRPFYQIPMPDGYGTAFTAAKLNGMIYKSNVKPRLFPVQDAAGRASLTYAEAARWLLTANGYDDTAVKPAKPPKTAGKAAGQAAEPAAGGNENSTADGGEAKDARKGGAKKTASVGVGWCGKTGPVMFEGDSLFETLMLNLTLLRDGKEVWSPDKPVWELDFPKTEQRTKIDAPDNLAGMLTLQSRRSLLEGRSGKVTGYRSIGGDVFEKKDAVSEQYTVWKTRKAKGAAEPRCEPVRHAPPHQAWRDIPAVFPTDDGKRPGVVDWVSALVSCGALGRRRLRIRITGVTYGQKDTLIEDVFTDAFALDSGLLGRDGVKALDILVGECVKCMEAAGVLVKFQQDLEVAKGCSTERRTNAKGADEALYRRLDQPFREWMRKLDPEADEQALEDACSEWETVAEKVAADAADALIREAGPKAHVGRTVKEGKRETFCSTVTSSNRFRKRIGDIYLAKGE